MKALRTIAFAAAAVAVLLLAASGPGTRWDLWSYRTGFALLRWAAYLGLAAALLSVLVLALPRARRPGVVAPVLALVAGLVAFYLPYRFQQSARAVPAINDITTDTAEPPQFITSPRPYPGEFAPVQRGAYPGLGSLVLAATPDEAFRRALAAAEAMGWEVVGRDAASGRLEAVATTPWFGFKDDVVVRVRPARGGSRIDVRSRSRVGRGDVGTNARRIRAYLERLQAFGGTLAAMEGPRKDSP